MWFCPLLCVGEEVCLNAGRRLLYHSFVALLCILCVVRTTKGHFSDFRLKCYTSCGVIYRSTFLRTSLVCLRPGERGTLRPEDLRVDRLDFVWRVKEAPGCRPDHK